MSKVAWSSVSEVPGLPFKTYEELVKSEKHGFAVDPGRGRELAFHLAGRVGRLGLLGLQLLPYVMVAVSIIAALFTGHYRLLLGIPIAVVTFFFANPMNPLKFIISMGSRIGVGLPHDSARSFLRGGAAASPGLAVRRAGTVSNSRRFPGRNALISLGSR